MYTLLSTHMKEIGVPHERIPEHTRCIQGKVEYQDDSDMGGDIKSTFTVTSNAAFWLRFDNTPPDSKGWFYADDELKGHQISFNHKGE